MFIIQSKCKSVAVIFYVLMMTTSVSCAAPGSRGGPPPEAIEACAELSIGDSCSFTGRRDDTVEGSCGTPRNEETLACQPAGGSPSQHGGPGR